MAEKDQEQEQGEEKSSKKLIIIIAVVILLLGGAGAGYFFISAGDSSETIEEAGEEPGEVAPELHYFDMPKPFIVNFAKGSSANLLQVTLSLRVAGETALEDLKKHEPMIRNNILMLMSAQETGKLNDLAGKEKLRAQMLEEINKVMLKMTQKEPVKELFFTAFVMQ